jgi:hypothetical protein
VVRELDNLLAMPSAGDIVLYGHYAAEGCVNFLGERGSHAGPSEDELYGFVLAPSRVAFDGSAVDGPTALHRFFGTYQVDARDRKETDDRQGTIAGCDLQHSPRAGA